MKVDGGELKVKSESYLTDLCHDWKARLFRWSEPQKNRFLARVRGIGMKMFGS